MKIAYLLHFNSDMHSGVFKKIQDQVKWWIKFKNEVKLFILTRNYDLKNSIINSELKDIVEIEVYVPNLDLYSLNKRLKAFNNITKDILRWNPDIVYTRQDLFYPNILKLRKKPLVIEINTYDLGEFFLSSKIRYIYNLITRHILLSTASGFVYVTSELSQMRAYKKYRKPSVIIANGIDLGEIESLSPSKKEDINLVFLGERGHPWHGIDKIVILAKYFPQWKFHLVGIEKEELSDSPVNVMCYGFLKVSDYIKLLESCDIAIGTLALHRKGMNEASPLKVREYLAFGIPVIIGYKDTDFPNGSEFILQLPNIENNIINNISKIEEFVLSWKGKRVSRDKILHIGSEEKERQRLSFFKSILE